MVHALNPVYPACKAFIDFRNPPKPVFPLRLPAVRPNGRPAHSASKAFICLCNLTLNWPLAKVQRLSSRSFRRRQVQGPTWINNALISNALIFYPQTPPSFLPPLLLRASAVAIHRRQGFGAQEALADKMVDKPPSSLWFTECQLSLHFWKSRNCK